MIYLLKFLRLICKFYKFEYGKYSILYKIFFPIVRKLDNKQVTIKVNKKYNMLLSLDEYIQGHLFLFNSFEPQTEKIFRKFIKKGDIAFDIGANIGYMSLMMADCVGQNGFVFAFEPIQNNFKSLINNISLNKFNNIRYFKLAISNTNSIIKIYKPLDNNQGSYSMIVDPAKSNQEYEEVQTTTLDDFVEQKKIEAVNFIKIDVEGAEYEVIQGMHKTISKFRPIIFMEINGPILQKRNIKPSDLKQLILNYQYICFNVDGKGNLEETPPNYHHNIDNVVFIPNKELSSPI